MLIALGLSQHSHHNAVTGFSSKIVEDRMSGEVYVLQAIFFTVEGTDLNLKDESVKNLKEVFNALVSFNSFDVGREFFSKMNGLFMF